MVLGICFSLKEYYDYVVGFYVSELVGTSAFDVVVGRRRRRRHDVVVVLIYVVAAVTFIFRSQKARRCSRTHTSPFPPIFKDLLSTSRQKI